MTAPATTTLLVVAIDRSGWLQAPEGERADLVLRAIRFVLAEAIATHGALELQTNDEELVVAFPSAAEAVGCAMRLQRHLARSIPDAYAVLRAGLTMGEPPPDDPHDYGIALVAARSLCNRAQPGRVLCSEIVALLLDGRREFRFQKNGQPARDHSGRAISTYEVLVEYDEPQSLPPQPQRKILSGASSTSVEMFRKDGDYWTLTFQGRTTRLRHMRGFDYLSQLLRCPGREFHATELVNAAIVGTAADIGDGHTIRTELGDAGPALDDAARSAYRRRASELREQLEDAERMHDLGRAGQARDEIETLLQELGTSGRHRRTASHAERARLAVTKGIKAALTRIAANHPALGHHLSATIRRGYFCVYLPAARRPMR